MGYQSPYSHGPPVTSDPGLSHIPGYGMMPPSQLPEMSHGLGPIGMAPGRPDYTSPQVSLPPMSSLQQNAFKDALHEAERSAEMGHYAQAEQALQNAMKSLEWMKNSGP